MTRRPAETAGAGAGGTVAILLAVGLSRPIAIAAAAAAGIVPATVTWLVTHGGLRGALRNLWRGTPP
jgi:hypothetical protein